MIHKSASLSKLGNHFDGLTLLNRVLEKHPANSDALYNKSIILGRLERKTESLSCLDMAIAQDSADSMNVFEEGRRLAMQGKHEEAIKKYTAALDIDAKNVKALVAKGWTLDFAGFSNKDIFVFYDVR